MTTLLLDGQPCEIAATTKAAVPLPDCHRYSKAAFVVYIEGRKLELPPHKFLEACWTDAFDTPCCVCKTQFDIAKAPPVRTLCLDSSDMRDISPLTKTLPPLIILNTHLECLKLRRIKYFPISHAWHHPVADAYEFRVSNPAAAKMVYEMPIRILIAAVQQFGPDVQIWHDYISIPQWQDSFRGAKILPQIFQIFKFGDCSIIHLDEQPAIKTLRTYSPENFIVQSSSLQHLFGARWFRRMWIVIEYDICRDAYLMNSNYELMPDTFTVLTRQIADFHVMCLRDNLASSQPLLRSELKWMEVVPMFVKEKVKNKCLGYIYDMIGNQECRSHRDRFVAACALLEVGDYLSLISEMPLNPQEACLWVSKRCLAGNDYSPLLLSPSTETQYDNVQWLKGHSAMTSNMWGLAFQTRAAQIAPRLQGNNISLKLDLAGTVVKRVAWRMSGANNCFGFTEVLPHVVELAAGSASRFLDCLERIYPSEFFWVLQGNTYNFPGLRYRLPSSEDFEQRLRDLLKLYSEASYGADTTNLEMLCEKLVSTLAYPSQLAQPWDCLEQLLDSSCTLFYAPQTSVI